MISFARNPKRRRAAALYNSEKQCFPFSSTSPALAASSSAAALAAEVRRRLEDQFDEPFGQWVALLAEVRPLVLAQVQDGDTRRDLFEKLCHWRWLERLRREGTGAVRAALLAEVAMVAAGGSGPL